MLNERSARSAAAKVTQIESFLFETMGMTLKKLKTYCMGLANTYDKNSFDMIF
jgi:hypothetical protein